MVCGVERIRPIVVVQRTLLCPFMPTVLTIRHEALLAELHSFMLATVGMIVSH